MCITNIGGVSYIELCKLYLDSVPAWRNSGPTFIHIYRIGCWVSRSRDDGRSVGYHIHHTLLLRTIVLNLNLKKSFWILLHTHDRCPCAHVGQDFRLDCGAYRHGGLVVEAASRRKEIGHPVVLPPWRLFTLIFVAAFREGIAFFPLANINLWLLSLWYLIVSWYSYQMN